jgi:NitT/TauT family transport system ATP-binding protein
MSMILPPGLSRGHIEVSQFAIRFGQNVAVSDISLHVEPGEFVSLIGPSGCGKSTVLNAVAGFLRPSAGTVLVDGEPVRGPSADRGMVFQQYSLFPWKTVRQNVEFGLKMQGMGKAERLATARTLLSVAGLHAFENHYPEQLSGGMKQRVGIIRALATGPRVLLLDEPFGALDAQTRIIMQGLLLDLWEGLKISVLFVTHDIDEAIYLSDRIYVVTASPGRIKAELTVPLGRPRGPEVSDSAEFLALRGRLHALIREESLRAMGNEVEPTTGRRLGRDLADAIGAGRR